MTPHLFVYGTLRRTYTNEFAIYLHNNAVFIGEGTMPGEVLDLGSYTGAVYNEEAGSLVNGEIFKLSNPKQVLATLDLYEAIGPDFPEPHEFKREQKNILLKGSFILCWVYLFNHSR